jgi:hypothetical protein
MDEGTLPVCKGELGQKFVQLTSHKRGIGHVTVSLSRSSNDEAAWAQVVRSFRSRESQWLTRICGLGQPVAFVV